MEWTEISPGLHIYGLDKDGPLEDGDIRHHGQVAVINDAGRIEYHAIRPGGAAVSFNLQALKKWVEGGSEVVDG